MARIVQSISDLERVIKECKEAGIRSIEMAGLRLIFKNEVKESREIMKAPIHFGDSDDHPEKNLSNGVVKAEELVNPMAALDQVSPDEILYYATPYYDELQAQKELHQEKLAEEGKENSDG